VSLKRQYQALDKLKSSEGWAALKTIMEREILDAAMAIANDPRMTLDEINFRRGSIWAANQLLNLPDRVLIKLENELALEAATSKAKAKADAATAA
jgi:hypothetical protein